MGGTAGGRGRRCSHGARRPAAVAHVIRINTHEFQGRIRYNLASLHACGTVAKHAPRETHLLQPSLRQKEQTASLRSMIVPRKMRFLEKLTCLLRRQHAQSHGGRRSVCSGGERQRRWLSRGGGAGVEFPIWFAVGRRAEGRRKVEEGLLVACVGEDGEGFETWKCAGRGVVGRIGWRREEPGMGGVRRLWMASTVSRSRCRERETIVPTPGTARCEIDIEMIRDFWCCRLREWKL